MADMEHVTTAGSQGAPHRTVGLAGLFDDVNDLAGAARALRDAGFSRWDCHTPYPVHGLDDAMGLRPSPIPVISLIFGFLGFCTAIALTYGLSVWYYPIHIGGKALFSWQAFVPIFFGLFVLFGAVSAFLSMFVLCRLGRWHSPLHDSGVMAEITRDRFAVVVEAADPAYSEAKVRALLEASGCRDTRPLIEHGEEDEAFI